MKVLGWLLRFFAFFWVLILSGGTFLQYYDFKNQSTFLTIKAAAVKTGWYLPAFYFHIIASSIILLVGFMQFSPYVYHKRNLHKLLGKVYVFGVLFFAAPGAYGMTFFINRGPWVFISFLVQNTLWVLFTLWAWQAIKNKKMDEHVFMMRRSYALAFAAVTLRLYIFILTKYGNGAHFANNYIIIAYLSWLPNLIFVELLNRFTKYQPPILKGGDQ